MPAANVVANPAFIGALAIVATLGIDELQCELIVTSCVDPSLNVPIAANCCVVPTPTRAFAGCRTIETNVPDPIVTVVLPLMLEAEAVTVTVPVFLACKMPLPRILAKLFFEERQLTFVSVAVLPSL